MTESTLEIRFAAPSHHGSGLGIAGMVDRAVLRDRNGMPYLAGSAIKGRLRHAAVRVLLAEKLPVCQYGDQTTVCTDSPCAVCALFGSVRRRGRLIFKDAYPTEEIRLPLSDLWKAGRRNGLPFDSSIRPGIAIDRQLGTVRKELLFSTETLPDWMVFRATILGDPGGHQELLKKAARILTHFGAGASRGLGRCEWSLT